MTFNQELQEVNVSYVEIVTIYTIGTIQNSDVRYWILGVGSFSI